MRMVKVALAALSILAATASAQEVRQPPQSQAQSGTLTQADLDHIIEILKAADIAYPSDPVRAMQIEARSADYVRQRYGERSLHMRRLHFMRAQNHTTNFRWREAEKEWRAYVDLAAVLNPGDRRDQAQALILVSTLLYQRTGQTDEQEAYVQRALTLLEPVKNGTIEDGAGSYATSAEYLASILLARGEFTDADRYISEAIAIRSRLYGPDSNAFASSLGVRAGLLEKQGRLRDAEVLWRRALPIRSAAAIYLSADANRALAWNLAQQSRFREAEPFARKAVDESRRARVVATSAVEQHGIILANLGRDAEAAMALKEACGDRQNDAARLDREGDDFGADARRNASACAAHLAMTMSRLGASFKARGNGAGADAAMDEAFMAAQAATASAANVALTRAAARVSVVEGNARPLVDEFESALTQRRALLARSETPQGASTADTRQVRLLDDRIVALSAEIGRRAPRYWELRYPEPITRTALQARRGPDANLLKENEALVLWLATPLASTGMTAVITKSDFILVPIPMTHAALAAEVQALRKEIDPGAYGVTGAAPVADTSRFSTGRAYRLYQALLGGPEIQGALQRANVDTLIVAPSGPLTALPPALLVTRPGAEIAQGGSQFRATSWLIREKAIAVIPSVSALRMLRGAGYAATPSRRDLSGNMIQIFANPSFGTEGSFATAGGRARPPMMRELMRRGRVDPGIFARMPPLPGSQTESELLVQTLHASPGALITGAGASEEELWRRNESGRLASARLISFATHGLVAGDADGLSEPALAFAKPAPGSRHDGLLTASEAAGLRLNADWVLLSACNTASPDGPEADGLSGLVRAFFHAGARSMLVSHWRVDDQATASLIVGTLSRFTATPTLSKARALQASMVAILDTQSANGAEMAHPSFWAPFVLVGRPD